jgi:hypothetical protein
MTTGIFLRHGDELTPLDQQPLASEDELQRLVEAHPELLATCFEELPTSWLLVRREAGVPQTQAGGDHYSLDHLLVTAEAIPVLVEVKRASNREIRRQIVGQMLDYAANATRYWPPERLTDWFAETHGDHASERLLECCGGDVDPEGFWAQVGTNLRAGRLRLVFVADDIPPELQAIVEFLSAQMSDAQIAAIKVQQFGDGPASAVAAQRVGETTATRSDGTKSSSYSESLEGADDDFKQALARVEQWGVSRDMKLDNTSKARRLVLPCGEGAFYLYPQWGTLEVRVGPLRRNGYAERADEIAAMVGQLPTGKAAQMFPSVKTSTVRNQWDAVLPVLNVIADQLDDAYARIKATPM